MWKGNKETNFCQLWLTVGNKDEADRIANTLLVKHLVACVHKIPISSEFQWQGKIKSGKEVLLQMDSREDLFDQVEREVIKLHSYDTPVLSAVPITKISKKANKWLSGELID